MVELVSLGLVTEKGGFQAIQAEPLELFCNCFHKTGFTTSSHTGDYFNNIGFMVKVTDLLKVVFTRIPSHIILPF